MTPAGETQDNFFHSFFFTLFFKAEMAKKISKTKGLVCVSLVFVLYRRNEKAGRDFSEEIGRAHV